MNTALYTFLSILNLCQSFSPDEHISILHQLTDLNLVKPSHHLQHLQLCRSGLKLHYIWIKMRRKFEVRPYLK
jgi:hypothetical protein